MVGLALYCKRRDMMDRYIQIVLTDFEAAAINLGYHLIYYGDLPFGSDYYIQEIEQCEKTVAALFRHLKDKDYQIGWSLDILTLTTLLQRQGTSILRESQKDFLKAFFQKDYSDLGKTFQQENERLKVILEGVLCDFLIQTLIFMGMTLSRGLQIQICLFRGNRRSKEGEPGILDVLWHCWSSYWWGR
jgi:hypothetical protein